MQLEEPLIPTTKIPPASLVSPQEQEELPTSDETLSLAGLLDPETDISDVKIVSEPHAVQQSPDMDTVKKILSDFLFVRNALSKPFYFEKSTAKIINKESFSRELTSLMPLKETGKPMDPLTIDRELDICEVVDGLGYRPITELPIYTDSEQITYANVFRRPKHLAHTVDMVAEVMRILTAHMIYLFGERDADHSGKILLSYLAHIIQFPAKPALWAVLLFGEALGSGKTLLLEIIRNAIGGSNFKNFDGNSLKETFTSLGAFGLLHVIEEIHLNGTSRWQLMNDLKPRISNSTVKVRKMYQDAFDQERYARIVATSNYADALPVTEQDRRWCVLQTYGFETTEVVNDFKKTPVGKKHYADLAMLEEEEWGGAVLEFFQNYQINHEVFDPHQPAVTEAKKRMAHASRSDDTFLMFEAIEKHAGHDITTDSVLNITRLKKLVSQSNKETSNGSDLMLVPQRKALGHAVSALGFRPTPEKFDFESGGKRVKGMCFIHRNFSADTLQFRDSFIRAERGLGEPEPAGETTQEMFEGEGNF